MLKRSLMSSDAAAVTRSAQRKGHSQMTEDAERIEEPPVVTGSREQMLHLLAEAAEIEHILMCSYVYAAFSLKRGEAEGLSAIKAPSPNPARRRSASPCSQPPRTRWPHQLAAARSAAW